MMYSRLTAAFAGVILVTALAVTPASGYIHFPPPTMPKMCQQSTTIRVLTVKKHDKDKGVIVYEVAATLKGKTPGGMSFRHAIGKESKQSQPIFDWVAEGKKAVMFTIEGPGLACGYVFIDRFCYSVDYNKKAEFWLLVRLDPEMAATFHGTAEKLHEVTKGILAGKDVKVPVDESVKAVPYEERRKLAAALNEILVKNREK